MSVHELCSNSADQTCTGKPDHPDMASDNSNELPDGILLADLFCGSARAKDFRSNLQIIGAILRITLKKPFLLVKMKQRLLF